MQPSGEGTESDITADATGAVGNVVSEAHPSFDAAEQLADLERDGVYGAVLTGRITDMPNGIPADAAHISSAASYNAVAGTPDAGVRISKRIVNMSGVIRRWAQDRTRRVMR